VLHSRAIRLDNFSDATNLFELVLQFVNLAEYLVHAGDFGVSNFNSVAGAIIL
jgi:hypothetical protein